MNYHQALIILAQASQQKMITDDYWNFSDIKAVSAQELTEIQNFTQHKLPQSYYDFLRICGTGRFFENYGGFGNGIWFFNLAEMQENQRHYQETLADDLPFEEVVYDPSKHDLIIVGVQVILGDWIGFNPHLLEPNFAVFVHEYPTCYYADDATWKKFEDWIIQCVELKGEDYFLA